MWGTGITISSANSPFPHSLVSSTLYDQYESNDQTNKGKAYVTAQNVPYCLLLSRNELKKSKNKRVKCLKVHSLFRAKFEIFLALKSLADNFVTYKICKKCSEWRKRTCETKARPVGRVADI